MAIRGCGWVQISGVVLFIMVCIGRNSGGFNDTPMILKQANDCLVICD